MESATTKKTQSRKIDRENSGSGGLVLFLKGMCMGLADSVPGVSGGTIAVITNIYEELIDSLKRLNPLALKIWHREGFGAFWRAVNGSFLLTLLAGIVTSLVLAANVVLYLLDEHFPLVMAFFIGLVLASTVFLKREVTHWGGLVILCFLLGAGLTLMVAFANPLQGDAGLIYVFFCGCIAICAMILPGLSGAFILILLGAYDFVLNALRSVEIAVILVFVAGCATGLLSFAHLLSWTFHHYRQQTYAFLTGMLLASVVVLWPWKYVTGSQAGAPGEDVEVGNELALESVNVLPGAYEVLTGADARLLPAIFFAVLGYLLVYLLEKVFSDDRRRG